MPILDSLHACIKYSHALAASVSSESGGKTKTRSTLSLNTSLINNKMKIKKDRTTGRRGRYTPTTWREHTVTVMYINAHRRGGAATLPRYPPDAMRHVTRQVEA